MPETVKLKIGRSGYIQRIGEKDYIKMRSRIESLPMRKLVAMNRLGGRTWKLVQEGRDFYLVLEALTWEEEEKAIKKGKYP